MEPCRGVSAENSPDQEVLLWKDRCPRLVQSAQVSAMRRLCCCTEDPTPDDQYRLSSEQMPTHHCSRLTENSPGAISSNRDSGKNINTPKPPLILRARERERERAVR